MATFTFKLAPREVEVLCLVADGRTNKEIAKELTLSAETVKTYLDRIFETTGTSSRTALASLWTRMTAAEVPPGALEGYWLSRYDFDSYLPNSEPSAPKYRRNGQINLERLTAAEFDPAVQKAPYFGYTGESVNGASTAPKVYMHRMHVRVVNRMAIGTWENTNSPHVGVVQLCVHHDLSAMHGGHLGSTSNGAVKAARWVWLRVGSPAAAFKFPADRLKPYAQLEQIFRERAEGDAPELRVEDLYL